MSDSLSTYLADHLAGSVHAIDLLRRMRDAHRGDSLRFFAEAMLPEIEADRAVLQDLAVTVGSGSSGLKELTAWVTEKVSRLKLGEDDFGTFLSLEFLLLGIHGKFSLWRALGAIRASDPRLSGVDFEKLAERARVQEALVEERRLEGAHIALGRSNR
jgi:hypothetical protein